jgi:hypothetical protein
VTLRQPSATSKDRLAGIIKYKNRRTHQKQGSTKRLPTLNSKAVWACFLSVCHRSPAVTPSLSAVRRRPQLRPRPLLSPHLPFPSLPFLFLFCPLLPSFQNSTGSSSLLARLTQRNALRRRTGRTTPAPDSPRPRTESSRTEPRLPRSCSARTPGTCRAFHSRLSSRPLMPLPLSCFFLGRARVSFSFGPRRSVTDTSSSSGSSARVNHGLPCCVGRRSARARAHEISLRDS